MYSLPLLPKSLRTPHKAVAKSFLYSAWKTLFSPLLASLYHCTLIWKVLYFFIVHWFLVVRMIYCNWLEGSYMKKSQMSIERCATVSTIEKILGWKWKIEILYYIGFQNIQRFGELRRHIGDITESSLTKQLRELEADGFISRFDYKEVPPRVEYSLTELGKSFMPVLEFMKQWGENNLN